MPRSVELLNEEAVRHCNSHPLAFVREGRLGTVVMHQRRTISGLARNPNRDDTQESDGCRDVSDGEVDFAG